MLINILLLMIANLGIALIRWDSVVDYKYWNSKHSTLLLAMKIWLYVTMLWSFTEIAVYIGKILGV